MSNLPTVTSPGIVRSSLKWGGYDRPVEPSTECPHNRDDPLRIDGTLQDARPSHDLRRTRRLHRTSDEDVARLSAGYADATAHERGPRLRKGDRPLDPL